MNRKAHGFARCPQGINVAAFDRQWFYSHGADFAAFIGIRNHDIGVETRGGAGEREGIWLLFLLRAGILC